MHRAEPVTRLVDASSPVAQVIVSSVVALVSGVAAVALPAPDRQQEIEAGVVRHLARVAGCPANSPTSARAPGDRASRRAVRPEQADLESVRVVHRHAGRARMDCERARTFLFDADDPHVDASLTQGRRGLKWRPLALNQLSGLGHCDWWHWRSKLIRRSRRRSTHRDRRYSSRRRGIGVRDDLPSQENTVQCLVRWA